ncbi:helix-turn-helix transcriptional regulator [Candidatus Gottesmanbacteria bacterium]|nr:helix-turn-helix transcriptional regulator [Candidatus Gottesmanbacteria bacterium]
MTPPDHRCLSKTLKVIGSKWTIPILHELCDGTRRFGELARALPGVSPKTLTLRLRELEHSGVIQKKVFAQVPLRVEYSLTLKGKSLRAIITKMRQWGEQSHG